MSGFSRAASSRRPGRRKLPPAEEAGTVEAMSSTTDRNARLDQLVTDTTAWASTRQSAITAQVAQNTAILQGRTGSGRLAQSAVSAASDLVVNSISDFLSS